MSQSFLVLDERRNRVLYRAETLSQARGFADGNPRPTSLAITADQYAVEWLYQVSMVDIRTGKVVCRGPVFDLQLQSFDEAVGHLRIVVLPVLDGETTTEVAP